MTQSGLGRSLASILSNDPEIDDDRPVAPPEPALGEHETGTRPVWGLGLAYEALGRLVTARGLHDAVVVIDDPDVGRQLVFAGRRPPTDDDHAHLDRESGCYVEPPVGDDAIDLVLAHGLCTSAFRVALLDDAPVRPVDALELALRRLPGVYAVAVDDEDPVVQLHATADAEPDLARRAGGLARAHLDDVVAIEIVRHAPQPPAVNVASVPETADQTKDERTSSSPELLALQTVVDTAELEVHLRYGEVRTIGRAPLASGSTGAVDATLGALSEIEGVEAGFELSWVHTVETTPSGRFVVATGLQDAQTLASRYGIATGNSPIEAAARAALDALDAPDDTPPTVHWAGGADDTP